jgi:predicted ATPase
MISSARPAYGLAGFIGREQQLADIAALMATSRLVTLTGPGGAGKTRLALQIAPALTEGFPDGVFFVGLASIADPHLVIPAIAQELGAQESPGKSLMQTLNGHLRSKRTLLVLDNFEHLLTAAPQVAELLSSCPGVKVLAASRAGLHIYGEQEYRVPPLNLPARANAY